MIDLGLSHKRTLTSKEQANLLKSLDHDLVGKNYYLGTMTTGSRSGKKQALH